MKSPILETLVCDAIGFVLKGMVLISGINGRNIK